MGEGHPFLTVLNNPLGEIKWKEGNGARRGRLTSSADMWNWMALGRMLPYSHLSARIRSNRSYLGQEPRGTSSTFTIPGSALRAGGKGCGYPTLLPLKEGIFVNRMGFLASLLIKTFKAQEQAVFLLVFGDASREQRQPRWLGRGTEGRSLFLGSLAPHPVPPKALTDRPRCSAGSAAGSSGESG